MSAAPAVAIKAATHSDEYALRMGRSARLLKESGFFDTIRDNVLDRADEIGDGGEVEGAKQLHRRPVTPEVAGFKPDRFRQWTDENGHLRRPLRFPDGSAVPR